MSRGLSRWLVLALVVGGWLGGSDAKAAGQELCNETSYVLYTAIGFPDATGLVSEGWTRLRPGECRSVLPAPVLPGEYFVYGRSSPVHLGGIRQWSGPVSLCVDVDDFSISGLANCENLGLETRGFFAIEGNAPEGRRTVFAETGEHKERAMLAGIQRLLADNVSNPPRIDGYAGRRTRVAIERYLKEVNVSSRPSNPELIDLLESTARKKTRTIGLEVCNEADGAIWTAYARRKNQQWESRGWWSLAEGTCVQLINVALGARDKYYVYAGLVSPDGEQSLEAAAETFCVSKVKFSIFGRHDCEPRGYQEVSFSKIETVKSPRTRVVFKPEDFGGESSVELRLR